MLETSGKFARLSQYLRMFVSQTSDITPEEMKRVSDFIQQLDKKLRKGGKGKVGLSDKSGGKGPLYRSAEMGRAPLSEDVARLRNMGVSLPRDDEEAENFVKANFLRSIKTYREFPDGTWGLLRSPAPKLVS
jgi:hypothetical protein